MTRKIVKQEKPKPQIKLPSELRAFRAKIKAKESAKTKRAASWTKAQNMHGRLADRIDRTLDLVEELGTVSFSNIESEAAND
jgi:chromatin segregation and condensation protein Rec8/ScpA/Scc1 (kleisin family)